MSVEKVREYFKTKGIDGRIQEFEFSLEVFLRELITVISCYRILVKPLKTLKFSWVSSPSHLVSCYIVLPLVMTSDKGKNKGKKIW